MSGLDRDELIRTGRDPREAMNACAAWVRENAAGRYPVFAAYPLSFDWMWMYWCFISFADDGSPFGHSRRLDMKTMYAVKPGEPIYRAGKVNLPRSLTSKRPHTNNALNS